MPERHLSASKRKQQVSNLLLYISKFFCFLRDTAVSAFNSFCSSVYARRSLGRIFAVAQMRTTAKHGFAAYSLENSLQTKKEQAKPAILQKPPLCFFEIRPFPHSILFVCPCMRGGASAGFSLSLKCERRQSYALPRTPSRTRSKQKRTGKTCSFLFGAGNEIRTRDICLGKATLYH